MTGGGPSAHATPGADARTAASTLPEPGGERARAVAQVAGALRNGRGSLVLGAAGAGKTHLVSLALTAAAIADHEADRSMPTAPATDPFQGLARLLGLTQPPRSHGEATDAIQTWIADAGGAGTLLRVEDAHLLDRPSAEVIANQARRGDVLLVATARPVAGSMSPWHELWRDDVIDRLDLQDLSPADTEAMLVSLLGGSVLPDTVRVLWQETGGNAFHVRELVADQLAAGTLERRDGVWKLSCAPLVTTRLLDIVRRDLAELPASGLLALQGLALLGPMMMSSLLDAVGHGPVAGLLRCGLVRTASLGEQPDVVIELTHPLLGHALRQDIPPRVRRDILEQALGPDACLPLAPRTVVLMLAEGVTMPLATVRAAVATAQLRHRQQDVVEIVDAALAPTGLTDLSDVGAAALLVDRARALHRLDEPRAASADLDVASARLRRASSSETDDGELARLVVELTRARAELAQHHHNDVDAALGHVAAGRAWLASLPMHPSLPRRGLELDVARLTLLGYAGRHGVALRESVRLLEETPEPHLAHSLVCPTGLGLLQAGRFEEARKFVMRYQPLTTGGDSRRESAGQLSAVSFFAQLWSGEIANLDSPLSPALDIAHGTIPWAGAHVQRGLVAAANGAWSPARQEFHTANAAAGGTPRSAGAPLGLALEALAAAACSDAVAARSLLTVVEALPRGATAVFEGELRLLRLDTLVWLRDASALGSARDLAEWARSESLTRIEMEALHRTLVLRRWTDRPPEVQVLTRIVEIRRRVRSARASALVQHARALRQDDIELIEIAERDLNRRGLWLPPGRQALALTQREREIASLAKARLTSRVIAARLGLSSRTVDSHLASAFSKLGVSSREGLSHALT